MPAPPGRTVYQRDPGLFSKSADLARARAAAIRSRVTLTGAPADAVTISLLETPKTSKAKGGVLFSEMPAR